ncbi:MAG: aspartate/glutamate racemase family protein [Desulfocapsaceae bacterium]|nr:aspartate/glutamate racemase family protein [Desulfocapsaceae bacterium]
MKTIGLIGGMSWESTLEYYKLLNLGVKEALGGLHSAKILLHSVDFAPIEAMMQQGSWKSIAAILANAGQGLEKGGADFLLICTNTMHKLAPDIESSVNIPLLHIGDATGEALLAQGIRKVGLLGTAFTMEESFYKDRLAEKFSLEVLVPERLEREVVNRVIFDELCRGLVTEIAKQDYTRIIVSLREKGAEAIVLGCTEIGMLVNQQETGLPLFDTTIIHARKAVALALTDG